MELEWPLVTLEPFLAHGRGALERLARRLEPHAVGCVRLDVSPTLEPDGCDTRSLDLPAPTRDVKTLLSLVAPRPRGPAARRRRDGLLPHRPPRRPAPRPAHALRPGRDLARPPRDGAREALRAARATGASARRSTVDGHRPERFALVPFAPPPPPAERKPPRTGRGLSRRARPRARRVPLEVLVEGERPTSRCARSSTSAPADGGRDGRRPDVAGAVRVASGPWRLEEGWWPEAPAFARVLGRRALGRRPLPHLPRRAPAATGSPTASTTRPDSERYRPPDKESSMSTSAPSAESGPAVRASSPCSPAPS